MDGLVGKKEWKWMQQKQRHHPLSCQTWHLHSPSCNSPADNVVKRFCYVILMAADVASSCYWPQAEMGSRLQRSGELTSFHTLLYPPPPPFSDLLSSSPTNAASSDITRGLLSFIGQLNFFFWQTAKKSVSCFPQKILSNHPVKTWIYLPVNRNHTGEATVQLNLLPLHFLSSA